MLNTQNSPTKENIFIQLTSPKIQARLISVRFLFHFTFSELPTPFIIPRIFLSFKRKYRRPNCPFKYFGYNSVQIIYLMHATCSATSSTLILTSRCAFLNNTNYLTTQYIYIQSSLYCFSVMHKHFFQHFSHDLEFKLYTNKPTVFIEFVTLMVFMPLTK